MRVGIAWTGVLAVQMESNGWIRGVLRVVESLRLSNILNMEVRERYRKMYPDLGLKQMGVGR